MWFQYFIFHSTEELDLSAANFKSGDSMVTDFNFNSNKYNSSLYRDCFRFRTST
ncbi:hypothetical protein Hanom_Chr17g01585091 [Helianthus anomalus]